MKMCTRAKMASWLQSSWNSRRYPSMVVDSVVVESDGGGNGTVKNCTQPGLKRRGP